MAALKESAIILLEEVKIVFFSHGHVLDEVQLGSVCISTACGHSKIMEMIIDAEAPST